MTPTLLTTLTTTSPPTTLLFPTKTYILFSTHTKITIHNTTTQRNIVELTKHNWTINALATTKDTEKIVSAGRGTECFLWDTKTAHVERKIIAHESVESSSQPSASIWKSQQNHSHDMNRKSMLWLLHSPKMYSQLELSILWLSYGI